MLTDSTRKYLSRTVGLYDKKKTIMSFDTVLCLIPKKCLRAPVENNGNWTAAGCQLFYRKIYGNILQCTSGFAQIDYR